MSDVHTALLIDMPDIPLAVWLYLLSEGARITGRIADTAGREKMAERLLRASEVFREMQGEIYDDAGKKAVGRIVPPPKKRGKSKDGAEEDWRDSGGD